jgi:glycosyltransferase involved in cell wall biosynthesis
MFDPYVLGLNQLVHDLGLKDVHFTGHVSDEELVSYYEVADLFLCASEHEGFCVPIVEAFYKQVPVLAFAAAAVPSTMGAAGVLFHDKDPRGVALLMDAIVSTVALQDAIVEGQTEAVGRLMATDFAGILLGFIDSIFGSPRAGAPHVSYDFWHQFDTAERLEEMRQLRPSLYQASSGLRVQADLQRV